MANKIKIVVILSIVLTLVLTGCATRIPLVVQRTPTLDTVGIRRIAIMPFEAVSPDFQNAAIHATTTATARIRETNHFTLVSAQHIQTLQRQRQSIESYVDALFVGQITRIDSQTNREQHQTTNRQTGETTTHVTFVRDVEVHFNYSFVRARDGSLIGPVNRRGTLSIAADSQGLLPSVNTMANQIIDRELSGLARDVAPHTVRVTRTLERESDRSLRPQMDIALSHVRSGSYRLALQSYLNIWHSYNSTAAAINAAILYEALGETQNAANFLQGVLAVTGNPRVRNALAVVNRELRETAGAAAFTEPQRQTERVASHANAEIQRVLPANARVWIHNNATANQNMVNDVIDNLTSSFLRNNITVVDRDSLNLLMAEQNFQLQGNVNDDEFVSIGNLAGANKVVIINITGAGAGRRLQVRVLDIERGVPVFQSDTSESWML